MNLDDLLAAAWAADGQSRMGYRDEIAEFGEVAVIALAAWIHDEERGAFVVRAIEAAATFDAAEAACRTLRASRPSDPRVAGDVREAIARICGPGRLTDGGGLRARGLKARDNGTWPTSPPPVLLQLLARWD